MLKSIILTVSLALMGLAAQANAQEQYELVSDRSWVHFGADPAYASREEAIADAPNVLRQVGYSEDFIEDVVEAMQQPGTACEIANDDTLAWMRSGSDEIWGNVDVDFESPPVDRMSYSAPAECWTFTDGETELVIAIPFICFNLLGIERPVEVREVRIEVEQPPEECAMIVFPATQGWHVRNFFLSEESRLPTSDCWALMDGIDNPAGALITALPSPCDRCDLSEYLRWARRHGVRGEPANRVLYQAERGDVHAVIVPLSQTENYNTVCVGPELQHSTYSPVTVEPTDWEERERVVIELPHGRNIAIVQQATIQGEHFEPLPRRRQWLWW